MDLESEASLLDVCTEHLKASNIVFKRNYMGPINYHGSSKRPNPNAGFPDLDGYCANGRGWAMELKKKGKDLDEKQIKWREKMQSTNVLHFVIKSFAEYLEAIKIIKKEK